MSGRFVSRRSFALGSLAAAALTVMPAARTQYGAVSASAADVRLPGPHKLLQSRLVRTPGYGAATLFWPREPQARCPVVVTFPGYTGKAEEMHTIRQATRHPRLRCSGRRINRTEGISGVPGQADARRTR